MEPFLGARQCSGHFTSMDNFNPPNNPPNNPPTTLLTTTEEEVLPLYFIKQQSQASERKGHPKAGPTAGRCQEIWTHIWL